jgi:hypothetical protein
MAGDVDGGAPSSRRIASPAEQTARLARGFFGTGGFATPTRSLRSRVGTVQGLPLGSARCARASALYGGFAPKPPAPPLAALATSPTTLHETRHADDESRHPVAAAQPTPSSSPTDSRSVAACVTAARCAAAQAKPAPNVHGVERGRAGAGPATTMRPRPRHDAARDESVPLLGGAGAGTTESYPRGDARDKSAIQACGACGAGTTGFPPRSASVSFRRA